MSSAIPSPHTMRFGLFELDVHAGELRKRGVKIPLQGLPIQILGILLENPGQVVTRDELRTRLWRADTFVDFEHSLHNAIARLREALVRPRATLVLSKRFHAAVTDLLGHSIPAPLPQ